MSPEQQRDEDYANDIRVDCMTGDQKADHSKADHIVIKLLRAAGYNRTADAWDKVGKWYA